MAQLFLPRGVFVSNGEIYFADTFNHRVRKVLRNGQIVTIAGTGIRGYNGDGQLATDAQLFSPCSVVVSSSDQVYISDANGHRIRKIDQHGIISTIAGIGIQGYNGDDKLAIQAQLNRPYGLFVTEDEEILIADGFNYRVRKIDRNGIITTIAGSGNYGFDGDGGLATSAKIWDPRSVFQYKNEIYIADSGNNRIRKIDNNGIISTIEGTEKNIYVDSVFVCNDEVYFTDSKSLVFKILQNGIIKTIAGIKSEEGFNGNDMLATQCKLNCPKGIFVDNDSQVYIADTYNHCIRRIDQNGIMRNVIGTAGKEGYSGDVPFDFQKYPHIGPRKKQLIKPFPHAYHDLIVICVETDSFDQ